MKIKEGRNDPLLNPHISPMLARSNMSPMRRFAGFNKGNKIKKRKVSVASLKAYSMARCQPDCKLPDIQLAGTIEQATEIFKEVELMSGSKQLKAKGFNRMQEV